MASTSVETSPIPDEATLRVLRDRAVAARTKAGVGDMSLGEILAALEYELAEFHGGAYLCGDVQRFIKEIHKRVGE